MMATEAEGAIDAVWRIESAKLIAGLARIVGDIGQAEDLAQRALLIARASALAPHELLTGHGGFRSAHYRLPQHEYTAMRVRVLAMTLALTALPRLAAAQDAPVAQAFRDQAASASKNLQAAAALMPEGKYSFKSTPAQMSYGDIVAHLVEGNDYLCGAIGGIKAPARAKVAGTSSKADLTKELKETFAFCDQALAKLDDSKLTEQLPFFDGKTRSRANVLFVTVSDWADHYSQSAIYLRLNGLLPPTAKK